MNFSPQGPGVLQGDSGGGLLFRENNFYHIRGVVSLKQPTETAIAAFTDLADYVDWILAVRNSLEQEVTKEEIILPSKKIPTGDFCQCWRYPYSCWIILSK